MKCANCNGNNVEGTRFCMYCGTQMIQYQQPQNQQMYQQRVQMQPMMRMPKKPMDPAAKKKMIKVVGIAAGAFAFLLTIILIVSALNNNVDIEKYVQVSYSGKDGNGRATCSINKEAFLADYTGKIEYSDEYKEKLEKKWGPLAGSYMATQNPAEDFLKQCVDVSVRNGHYLSNGDVVRIDIKINERKLKNFDVEIEDSMFKVTAEGLGEKSTNETSKIDSLWDDDTEPVRDDGPKPVRADDIDALDIDDIDFGF